MLRRSKGKPPGLRRCAACKCSVAKDDVVECEVCRKAFHEACVRECEHCCAYTCSKCVQKSYVEECEECPELHHRCTEPAASRCARCARGLYHSSPQILCMSCDRACLCDHCWSVTIGDETGELGACPECDVLDPAAKALEKFAKTGRTDNSTVDDAATWWMDMHWEALCTEGVRDQYPKMPAMAIAALESVARGKNSRLRAELVETLRYLVHDGRRRILNTFDPPLSAMEVVVLLPAVGSLVTQASTATSIRARRKAGAQASRELRLLRAGSAPLNAQLKMRFKRLEEKLSRIRQT